MLRNKPVPIVSWLKYCVRSNCKAVRSTTVHKRSIGDWGRMEDIFERKVPFHLIPSGHRKPGAAFFWGFTHARKLLEEGPPPLFADVDLFCFHVHRQFSIEMVAEIITDCGLFVTINDWISYRSGLAVKLLLFSALCDKFFRSVWTQNPN